MHAVALHLLNSWAEPLAVSQELVPWSQGWLWEVSGVARCLWLSLLSFYWYGAGHCSP